MLFKSPVYSQASGSIAGITYSRNRGGMYTRSRAIPTDPNTPQQQTMRSLMGLFSAGWTNILSAAQRTAWNTYGSMVTVVNRVGDPIHLTGQQHFLRSNLPRAQLNAPVVLDAPTIYNLGEFTPVTLSSASAGGGTYSVAFTDTDEWVDEDDSYMIAFNSRSIGAGISYFKGPYQAAEGIEGDSVTPPTTPWSVTSPFVLVQNNLLFVRLRVSRADGRLSQSQYAGPATIGA